MFSVIKSVCFQLKLGHKCKDYLVACVDILRRHLKIYIFLFQSDFYFKFQHTESYFAPWVFDTVSPYEVEITVTH